MHSSLYLPQVIKYFQFSLLQEIMQMIHNDMLKTVTESADRLVNNRSILNPPISYVIEALHLCLECSISIYNHNFCLQRDRTVQGLIYPYILLF